MAASPRQAAVTAMDLRPSRLIARLAANGALLLIACLFLVSCGAAPGVGQNAKLVSQDGNDLLVAVTESAYEAERKAISSGDMQALTDLILSGQLVSVPNGTPVLVVERTRGMCKVLVGSGAVQGLTGWVPGEFVK